MILALTLLAALLAPSDVTLSGKECRIKTDLKPAQAKDVPKRIDLYCEHFQAFYEGLGLKPRASNKVVIRLFARYEDYVEFYQRSTPGGDAPAAYFSPSLNGVVAYHDPEDPYLRQVLFHETSHQYMERYTSHAPKWANEGLAEYFEGWRLAPDGALIDRRPPFYDLLVLQRALASGTYLKPRELMEMDPAVFMKFREEYEHLDGYLHYATSWGLTWYLLEGGHEQDRARYVAYLERLSADGARAEPFAPSDWPEWDAFEQRWKAYVLGLKIEPQSADDHVILAANLRQEGEPEQAIEHYAKALELDPKTPDARYWLGWCCKRTGDYDRAREQLVLAAEERPEDPSAPYLLARIESGVDRPDGPSDPEKALAHALEASRRANDESPVFLAFVAHCQHQNGDAQAAEKTMKKVLKLVKDEDEAIRAAYEELLQRYAR